MRFVLTSLFKKEESPEMSSSLPSSPPVPKRNRRPSKQLSTATATATATVVPRSPSPPKRKRKATIPVALQEAIWIKHMGRNFEGKCRTTWCPNSITVFDFQAGHDIPESKGGPTTLDNLVPICARCNLSMGNRYTLKEWCQLAPPEVIPAAEAIKKKWWCLQKFKRSSHLTS